MGLIQSFKKWRLARQGLATTQSRQQANDALVQRLEKSLYIRIGLYALACTGLLLLVGTGQSSGFFNAGDPIRSITAVLAVYVTSLVMFHVNYEETARRNSRIFLIFGIIFVQLIALRGVMNLVEQAHWPSAYRFLLMPFALAPMIHSVLLGRNHGLFSAIFASLFGCLMIGQEDVLIYIVMSLVAGFMAVYLTGTVRRRSSLLRAGFYVGAVCLVLAYAFGLIAPDWGDAVQLKQAMWQSFSVFCTGLFTAMVISGLMPLLEGPFGITTPITWLELSDMNHPLIRRMQLEAPGTLHHSLMVAALSEAAAEKIGANNIMCRVCSYFHDIGKLAKPNYFIENQHESTGNPHDSLTPSMSALIIISHVKDGADLALKHKLNRRIVDVIREHHGDSLVSYFYHKALTQRDEYENKVQKGLASADDAPKIEKKTYRYPGPRPRSKESGIISLADPVESASRTLKKPTAQRIQAMINEVVDKRLCEGQLDFCELTIAEVNQIKESFAATLFSVFHSRIPYPEEAKKPDQEFVSTETMNQNASDSHLSKPSEQPHEIGKH